MQLDARSAIAQLGTTRPDGVPVLREPALFVLAAILMLSFSLFPRGYMPARTAGGGFTITLCSSAGLAAKRVDAPVKAPSRHIGSVTCDLVASAAVLPPERALVVTWTSPMALSLWSVRAFRIRFRAAFDPNAPPTAPPASLR